MFDSRRSHWRKLDNAAMIFPATSGKKDTKVFRFYCQLKEQVDEIFLQKALDRTMLQFPVFLSVIRRGLFWYYLEKTDKHPIVEQEHKPPCSNLFIRDHKGLLFEVTYFKNRINFEVYHVLTDGTGATQFLRELVKNYLLLAHPDENLPDESLVDEGITVLDQEDDSFSRYYSDTPPISKKKRHAYQLSKKGVDPYDIQVMECTMSVKDVLSKSRELGVSMTVFLTTVLLCAIAEDMSMKQRRKPVALMIPVNLRNFFPSVSMLNFFGWIDAGYQFDTGEIDFEKVLAHVKGFFESELSKERIAMRMNAFIRLERNPFLRLVPLELKNFCLQAGSRLEGKELTAVFSNMSVVKMPEEYVPYIERFGVYTSTNKTELCMCSFQDTVALGFTSRQVSQNVQRNFLRILQDYGIKTHVSSNEEHYPEPENKPSVALKFLQWFTFFCVAVSVICGLINVIATPYSMWAAYVTGSVLSIWILVSIGFYKRRNLLKNGIWQLVFCSAVAFIWDICTGWRGWSVNYVIPSIIVLVQILMVLLSNILKIRSQDHMIYYIMAAVFGLIPGVLLAVGVAKIVYLSAICTGLSLLFICFLLIFRHRELVYELKKKFHF